MAHIPFGYRIENAIAVIDKVEKEKIIKVFELYLEGETLQSISDKLNLNMHHGSVGRLLKNTKYLGDGFYPRIISEELFNKVKEIREQRATKLGRDKLLKEEIKREVAKSFRFNKKRVSEKDMFKRAHLLYEQIEIEGKDGIK